ncbi:PEP/pyruvate-binding domain-containing protein [Shimazuella kribbensis]|uniref:PEP/pyruvate-binding domain-containing protein n=1 Tax=Shimazuella kribbensis TaxID=139808 RepID=UPI0003F5F1CD|nr:PEP/pyruvate-binding domain-containing protein [Shimazuella kribbensis]
MSSHVKSFAELTTSFHAFAGGKGTMLAKMHQSGYPIPQGFVILSTAFKDGKLNKIIWEDIWKYVNEIRKEQPEIKFAVRSSALSEDSFDASFAGEFETVLNQKTDKEIQTAIETVVQSVYTERVQSYRNFKGLEEEYQIAVVVQVMVSALISGVLFTADPITGSRSSMMGNFVYGLGEQLVSGETDAHPFQLVRTKGNYQGPKDFKKYAASLYKMALKLEQENDVPQDIEWSVADGKLYLLQARPITTLSRGNRNIYDMNYSLSGDYLWTNANVGEAVPDVVTPLTWSILEYLDEEINVVPGYYLMSGNICGRIYTNISRRLSVYAAFGLKPKMALSLIGDVFGIIPEEMEMPIYPFTRWELLKMMYPKVKHYLKEVKSMSKNISNQIIDTPQWCQMMKNRIQNSNNKTELALIWEDELLPYHRNAWWMLLSGGTKAVLAMRLKKKLTKMVGEEDANLLLSNLRGEKELASLGPLLGIAKVLNEEMSEEEYAFHYGHRGPYEFELSISDPSENQEWLENQVVDFQKTGTNVIELLGKQKRKYKEAFSRFQQKYPTKHRWLTEQIKLAGEGAQLRESVRSEFVRVHRVIRTFMLQVGNVTNLGDDVFFLYLDEIVKILKNDEEITNTWIDRRKHNYKRFRSLPPFPPIIRGRFDPFIWEKNKERRGDIYDPALVQTKKNSEVLRGSAGAAGLIEGRVRILASPEHGKELEVGEILVAATTNVGWTPLFPKAAAIITDVGAPLSHAAIVARELGIPAVVGCGNATSRLKTGDRVIVNGGQGWVQIMKE